MNPKTMKKFDTFVADEESFLLGPREDTNNSKKDTFSERAWNYECDSAVPIHRIRRLADFLGGVFVATAAFMTFHPSTSSKPTMVETVQPLHLQQALLPPLERVTSKSPKESGLQSKYTKFQALGFQIYTGGAPAVLRDENGTNHHNPECAGINSYGKADDFDQDDAPLNLTDVHLWECYLGESNPMKDVHHRLRIMADAVAKAEEVSNKDSDVLKIFLAPEFFWRGKDGAYDVSDPFESQDDECEEICHILQGLEELVADPKYKDWLFLFGTVIVSETLPQEDAYDYLFYNFAPVYRGYDPKETDHFGKRFLVPKRYVSNIDFLTPVRQMGENNTKELMGIINRKDATVQVQQQGPRHQKSTTVHNPFQMRGHKYYDREMWHEYKEELEGLGYTMLEYDWLILDNITFTIEVCLDHDAHTALNAYLADNVLGGPTLIPKNAETYDHHLKRHTGWIEHVGIPRHQAQLSLVSSSGMTVNPDSMALTNNGTIILQDGLSSKHGSMSFGSDECENKGWHFAGGSEHISRSANLTSTEISFQYQIHSRHAQYGIWDELDDTNDTTWKKAIRGLFTTERYEPKITVYSPREIAKV